MPDEPRVPDDPRAEPAPFVLGAVTLDCADPPGLADFYARLLGWSTFFRTDEYTSISDGRATLCFARVAEHEAAPWPDSPAQPKRAHLDLFVRDVEVATAAAVALGATLPGHQPGASPDWPGHPPWATLLDPEGHPFCLLLPPELHPTDAPHVQPGRSS
ncbi:VOC family protein [Streptomyces youssoufiensis]